MSPLNFRMRSAKSSLLQTLSLRCLWFFFCTWLFVRGITGISHSVCTKLSPPHSPRHSSPSVSACAPQSGVLSVDCPVHGFFSWAPPLVCPQSGHFCVEFSPILPAERLRLCLNNWTCLPFHPPLLLPPYRLLSIYHNLVKTQDITQSPCLKAYRDVSLYTFRLGLPL